MFSTSLIMRQVPTCRRSRASGIVARLSRAITESVLRPISRPSGEFFRISGRVGPAVSTDDVIAATRTAGYGPRTAGSWTRRAGRGFQVRKSMFGNSTR